MKEYKRTIDHSWDFKGADTKEYTHCYHNYPAMMIPQIARRLIAEYRPEKCDFLLDPYCGSGTSLLEAILAGMGAVGFDLNPLARFISRTKCEAYKPERIENTINQLMRLLDDYSEHKVTRKDFSRLTKYTYWYSPDALVKLEYIQEIIEDIVSVEERDFFNLALAETVREASFTRNGEFKRYRMDEKKLQSFHPDVFGIFHEKLDRNLAGLTSFINFIKEKHYKNFPSAGVYDKNSCEDDCLAILPDSFLFDMVVTSPPYGDSRTTVAYGEFSRWANEWFGFEHAKDLDRILMGGQKEKEPIFQTQTTQPAIDAIRKEDEKRYYEVISFLNDYARSIKNVSKMIRGGGVVCYVVGNRTVKGVQIPLDYFTAEMFEQNGFEHIDTIVREFPTKRMPSKNSPSNKAGEKSSTMTNEYIVILKKK